MSNVPIQSLIDHIKTAIDVDPWAKEMAEELLEEQEPEKAEYIWGCPNCGSQLILKTSKTSDAIGLSIDECPVCGEKVRYGKVN